MKSDQSGGNVAVMRAIIDDCKKMKTCIHCGNFNGVVRAREKENLRIVHDKFHRKAGENEVNDYIEDLTKQFEHSCAVMPDLLSKRESLWEELDPQKVLQLF